MTLLAWILAFGLLGSLGSVLLAAGLLVTSEGTRQRLLPCLVSYAVGTLLGAAFLGLLPHALVHGSPRAVLGATLFGILLFFVLERLVVWRHCHEGGSCEKHGRAAAPLVLIGDSLHNFVDGVLVAAAFLTSVPLGIATGVAVIAHEVPQELGDFAILLDGGFSRGLSLLWNALSSLAALVGAVLGYLALEPLRRLLPFVLALSAASFMYVAIADLIPSLHERARGRAAAGQLAFVLAGTLTIVALQAAL